MVTHPQRRPGFPGDVPILGRTAIAQAGHEGGLAHSEASGMAAAQQVAPKQGR